jgi:hypothetical protein
VVQGIINVFVTAPDIAHSDKLSILLADTELVWPDRLLQLDVLFQAVRKLDLSFDPESPTVLAAVSKSLAAYLDYAQASRDCLSCLKRVKLVSASSEPSGITKLDLETLTTASTLQKFINHAVSSKEGPDYVLNTTTETFKAATDCTAKWVRNGDQGAATSLQDAVSNAMVEIMSAASQASKGVRLKPDLEAFHNLLLSVLEKRKQSLTDICNSSAGTHGNGGSNSNWEWNCRLDTINGKDGIAGQTRVAYLTLDPEVGNPNCDVVYAFPEQCDMLLARAERLFCSNDKTSRQSAMAIYAQLRRRLSFLPNLWAEVTKSPPTESSALRTAYEKLEKESELTMGGIATLKTILNIVQFRMDALMLGSDMFGNAANWVPRLSPGYYSQQADKLLGKVKEVEAATNNLSKARTEEATKKLIVQSGL